MTSTHAIPKSNHFVNDHIMRKINEEVKSISNKGIRHNLTYLAGTIAISGLSQYYLKLGCPVALALAGVGVIFSVVKTYQVTSSKLKFWNKTFYGQLRERNAISQLWRDRLSLPRNIASMHYWDLAEKYEDSPVKCFPYFGGNVRVELSSEIPVKELSIVLELIFESYPQTTRVVFRGFSDFDRESISLLNKFPRLNRISFHNCALNQKLAEGLNQIENLKRIDFPECRESGPFFESFRKDVIVSDPTGNCNKDVFLNGFFSNLQDLFKEHLIYILDFIKEGADAETVQRIERIKVLIPTAFYEADLTPRGDEINRLISEVTHLLNPSRRGHSGEEIERFNRFLQEMPQQNYFPVLASTFDFNLSHLFINDQVVELFLQAFERIRSGMTELNLSNTFITGSCLKRGGNGLQSLSLQHLVNLDIKELNNLCYFADLRRLDLSHNKIPREGLREFIKGLEKLKHLESLFLTGCNGITDALLTCIIADLNPNLGLLNIEGISNIYVDRIMELKASSQMNTLVVASTSEEGNRRINISRLLKVKQEMLDLLIQLNGERPIEELIFSRGSCLCLNDFYGNGIHRGLMSVPCLRIKKLDISQVNIQNLNVLNEIRFWPLEELHLPGGIKISIRDNIMVENNNRAAEIQIESAGPLTQEAWQFLNNFEEIKIIDLSRCHSFGVGDLARLSKYCSEKKVEEVILRGTNIKRDNLELIGGTPKPIMIDLMRHVKYIDLSRTDAQSDDDGLLFQGWNSAVQSGHRVNIRMPNEEMQVYFIEDNHNQRPIGDRNVARKRNQRSFSMEIN
jgi:hypothetical protein